MTSGRAKIEALSIPEPNSGCWLWLAGIGSHGYGNVLADGIKGTAHRASYRAFKGEIKRGYVVRHMCHNRLCVNPDHLEQGTYGDNSRDSVRSGASNSPKNKAGRESNRVLSYETIDEIRLLEGHLFYKEIAKLLKIDPRQVRNYVHPSQCHYWFRRPR